MHINVQNIWFKNINNIEKSIGLKTTCEMYDWRKGKQMWEEISKDILYNFDLNFRGIKF